MSILADIENLKREIKAKQNELARLEAINVEIPLEVGKTYNTKMTSGERFTVTKISKSSVWGIYERSQHLGECPLDANRLNSKTGIILL